MTKALIQLLRNRAVRALITELCVGIAVGVVTTLKRRESNEKRKRFLLCMQEGSCYDRSIGPEKEMRPEYTRSKIGQERQSWHREGSHQRNYM